MLYFIFPKTKYFENASFSLKNSSKSLIPSVRFLHFQIKIGANFPNTRSHAIVPEPLEKIRKIAPFARNIFSCHEDGRPPIRGFLGGTIVLYLCEFNSNQHEIKNENDLHHKFSSKKNSWHVEYSVVVEISMKK